MRDSNETARFANELEALITLPADETLQIELSIERICASVINELKRQGITDAGCDYLESHAYSINGKITDSEIRNLHIFYDVI